MRVQLWRKILWRICRNVHKKSLIGEVISNRQRMTRIDLKPTAHQRDALTTKLRRKEENRKEMNMMHVEPI